MELANWGVILGILLGLWGTILSTMLFLEKRREGRRQIKPVLEYDYIKGRYHLVITNVGYRPVTLTSASLDLFITEGGEHYFPIEFSHIFDPALGDPFPLILEDGDQARLNMNDFMTPEWLEASSEARFFVYDAERNSYRVEMKHVYRQGYDPGV